MIRLKIIMLLINIFLKLFNMDNATLISLFSLSIGFLSGFTILCMKLLFKSKCTNIEMCCIKIKRDVSSEVKCEQLELSNINNNINNNNNGSNTNRETLNLPIIV